MRWFDQSFYISLYSIMFYFILILHREIKNSKTNKKKREIKFTLSCFAVILYNISKKKQKLHFLIIIYEYDYICSKKLSF